MTRPTDSPTTRRRFLANGAALAAAAGFVPACFAIGDKAPVKIGILLPYAGAYARLGENITNAFKLRISEAGGMIGGRDVEYTQVDSEAKPAQASEKTNKLAVGEKVDFIVGPVHSGVAMAMANIVRGERAIMVCPNAGAGAVTGSMCAPNIFRTSFSNWQTSFPCGEVMLEDGHKNAVSMFWRYAAGIQMKDAFRESFTAGGGKIIKEIGVPFPSVEFQAYLTEIAALKPDAVFMFFAGGGAAKVVKDYAAAGLKGRIPLYGSGFLTEGVILAQGEAAEGIRTTLHYANGLDNPANKHFRAAFKAATGKEADVYAVQGYDAATLIMQGMAAVGGDVGAREDLINAMEKAKIDSPRGNFVLSKAHNPVQDFYLREVQGGRNEVLGIAHKALADPANGCKMG